METKKDFKCKECGSGDTYTTKDGTKVCRRCGFREVKENGN